MDTAPIQHIIHLPAHLPGSIIIETVRVVAGRDFYRIHRRTIDSTEVQMIGVNALQWSDDLLIGPGTDPNPMFFDADVLYDQVVVEHHVWPGDQSTIFYQSDMITEAVITFAARLEPCLLDRIPGRCVVCGWVGATDGKFCNQCGRRIGGNTGITTKLVLPRASAPILSDDTIQRLLLAVRTGAVFVAHGNDYPPPKQEEAKAFLHRMAEQIPIAREEFAHYLREAMSPDLMEWLRVIAADAFAVLLQNHLLGESDRHAVLDILEAFAAQEDVELERILTYLLIAIEYSLATPS